jgi:hypothetical protein
VSKDEKRVTLLSKRMVEIGIAGLMSGKQHYLSASLEHLMSVGVIVFVTMDGRDQAA